MHILVAPDSYKGSLSSLEAAQAVARGLAAAGIADTRLIPIADGGEGTVEALCAATNGHIFTARVSGPLGDPVDAQWGVLGDTSTAVVELAAASGLPLIPEERRNAALASTYGTGELIRLAVERGCKRVILGIGGSATTDGGAGLAQALGVRLTDEQGRDIGRGGAALGALAHVDCAEAKKLLAGVELIVACDVTNPLCGPAGAAAVYGPQKGATPEDVALLDAALAHYADVIEPALGIQVREVPGSGAAGGTGAGVLALLGGRLTPGFELIVRETNLEAHIAKADCVVTGEGCTDSQTLFGKVPMGIAQIAAKYGVPVVCLSGALRGGWHGLYAHGVTACFSISDGAITLTDSLARAHELLENAAEGVGRILTAGCSLGRRTV